jgi:Uma2 family endonuclease
MTPEEFDATPPARFVPGYRYEIINGVLVVSPYPGPGERSPNDYLGYLLIQYREGHPEGSVIDDTLPEQTVAATNRRRADRVVWIGLGRKPDEINDVPAIVIEFVSKRRRDALRDYELKRDEYLAAGVQQYWIIDRFRRVMIVYRKGLAGPTYDLVTETQTYQTELLPGFVLPLARLLEKADRWRPGPGPKPSASRPKKPRKPKPPAGGVA